MEGYRITSWTQPWRVKNSLGIHLVTDDMRTYLKQGKLVTSGPVLNQRNVVKAKRLFWGNSQKYTQASGKRYGLK